jgi:hypothetical protein
MLNLVARYIKVAGVKASIPHLLTRLSIQLSPMSRVWLQKMVKLGQNPLLSEVTGSSNAT